MTRRLAPFPLLLLLVACPTAEGLLDTEGVGIARYGQDYNAQVGVQDYSGPARYAISSGELPDGLSMDARGRILGTPLWAGLQAVEVTVTELRGLADITGPVEIDVRFDQVEGVFIGVERAWLNNFFHDPPHDQRDWDNRTWAGQGPDDTGMYDPWVRLAVPTPGPRWGSRAPARRPPPWSSTSGCTCPARTIARTGAAWTTCASGTCIPRS